MNNNLNNDRRYGISCISLLPWSFGPGGFRRAVLRAIRVGFDGIQALPLRGWRYNDRLLDPFVISTEDAWAYGGWDEIAWGYKGVLDERPLFRDKVLFGQEYFPILTTAIRSGHNLLEAPNQTFELQTAEIHPELSVKLEDYLDYVDRGGKICWDTHHIRRGFRNDGPNAEPVLDWKEYYHAFSGDDFGLIHVQPHSAQEEELFLKGEPCTLEVMLQMLRIKVPITTPLILEIAPNLKKIWKEPARQHAWLLRLKEVMG